MIVRFPSRAAATPRAAETVDLPTPPFPVTKIRRLSSSRSVRAVTLHSTPARVAANASSLQESPPAMRIPRAMGLLQRLGLPDQQPPAAAQAAAPPGAAEPGSHAFASAGERQTLQAEEPQNSSSEQPRSQTNVGVRQESSKRAVVIAFANQKGGVAKTTTTLNLAVAFSEAGHRVLAVDMDPQSNLTMSQGIDPDSVERSMYDVLVHHHPIRDVIRKREIDVACASIDLAGAEIAMSTQIGRERSLEKAIAPIKDDYDFICVDTPPSLGLLTINALTAADKVIVPVQCEYLSMRGRRGGAHAVGHRQAGRPAGAARRRRRRRGCQRHQPHGRGAGRGRRVR